MSDANSNSMIESLDDPRAAPYRNVKDRELARNGGQFIAEGENVVLRLMKSNVATESVLVTARKYEKMRKFSRDEVPVYCASDEVIAQIIGFQFHSGVMACGIRPEPPLLADVIPASPARSVVMSCQEIANAENMGSLIRIAAAFGASALVVGERCCDPYFRQSIRVSMGTIFSLPVVRSTNLLRELDWLGAAGFERLATVLAPDAERLQDLPRFARAAIVFGNEAQGLDSQTIARCDRRVIMPMKLGTDSLNVAVAAGVFLYQLTLEI